MTRLKMTRLTVLSPADGERSALGKRGLVDDADEGNRKFGSARRIQNLSAPVQRTIGLENRGVGNRALGNRKPARRRRIFLLDVCKQDDRNARCVSADPQAYDSRAYD